MSLKGKRPRGEAPLHRTYIAFERAIRVMLEEIGQLDFSDPHADDKEIEIMRRMVAVCDKRINNMIKESEQ